MSIITAAEYANYYATKELETYLSGNSKIDLSDPETKIHIDAELEAAAEGHRKIAQKLMREFKSFRPHFKPHNDMIFQHFPLEFLSKEEQLRYVYHIDNLRIDDGDIGNKYISNLKKINYDTFSQRLFPLYLTPPKETYFNKNHHTLLKKYRNIFSYHPYIHPNITKDMVKICYATAQKKEADSLHSLGDVVYESLISAIHCWVTPLHLPYQKRMEALTSIETFLDGFLKELSSRPATASTNIETSVPIFISILAFRTLFNEKLVAYETFHKEKNLEQCSVKELENEYKKRLNSDVPPQDDQSLRSILCDEQHTIRYDSFRKKLDLTYKTIEQLDKKGYSFNKDSLIDLKTVFRELFIYKSDNKSSPSLKIARKLTSEKDGFSISSTEEHFLIEQLSRGYLQFRASTAFCKQLNRVTLKLIHVIIENYLTYDLDTICRHLAYLFSEGMDLCSAQLFKNKLGDILVEVDDYNWAADGFDTELDDHDEELDL